MSEHAAGLIDLYMSTTVLLRVRMSNHYSYIIQLVQDGGRQLSLPVHVGAPSSVAVYHKLATSRPVTVPYGPLLGDVRCDLRGICMVLPI